MYRKLCFYRLISTTKNYLALVLKFVKYLQLTSLHVYLWVWDGCEGKHQCQLDSEENHKICIKGIFFKSFQIMPDILKWIRQVGNELFELWRHWRSIKYLVGRPILNHFEQATLYPPQFSLSPKIWGIQNFYQYLS